MTTGTRTYDDSWSSGGRPLIDDSPAPYTDERDQAAADSAHAHGLVGVLQGWAETAFGPAATSIARELGAIARQLTGPGQIKNPWLWVGAAGAVGFALGRSGALRPMASFAIKAALTTAVERALRQD